MKAMHGWPLPLALAVLLGGWTFATSERASRTLGGIWPVVSMLEIEDVEAVDVDGLAATRITGTAHKLRDCVFRGVSFYLHGPDDVPVDAKFIDKPAVNGVGKLEWDGLLVGIEPNRLWETYGEVEHNCSGIAVISPFFIGTKK